MLNVAWSVAATGLVDEGRRYRITRMRGLELDSSIGRLGERDNMAVYTIQSVEFPNVFLRMDGTGVTKFSGSGGGKANCQYGAGGYEWFHLVDQGAGMVAIGAVNFANVYLRMDGLGVTKFSGGGAGVVNCQFGVGGYEKFRIAQQGDGTVRIASTAFPDVFLRMDGTGVAKFAGTGGGVVNCQYGAGAWEKFRLSFG